MKNKNIDFQIEQLKSVNNPNSIHGIYPYRGKISSLEAKHFIKQMPVGSTLLDPFCGSGTIVYEGLNQGLKTYGVDLNPIAIHLSKGKINIPHNINIVEEELKEILAKSKKLKKYKEMSVKASRYFHENTAREISQVTFYFESMSDYLKACFLGSICLAARGCNHYMWTSSTVGKDINPKRYINFFDKFEKKTFKHYFPSTSNNGKIYFKDARKLSKFLSSESVDFVFTSPPYFDGLDYTAYYAKIIYEILGVNRLQIKSELIQSFDEYEKDMKLVLEQINIITKKNAQIIFVVGDKKIHGRLINGGEFFNSISPFKNVKYLERIYSGSSSQVFDKLNKTVRKEHIIIWQK